jgi:hypothetical protein
MTSKIEKLEKLMVDAEGLWDWEHEARVYLESLRNSAPILLEIVKAAKFRLEADYIIKGARICCITPHDWELLQTALQKFEESEI